MGMLSASAAVPALPGAQKMRSASGDWAKEWTRACSLPPPPTTSTRMRPPAGVALAPGGASAGPARRPQVYSGRAARGRGGRRGGAGGSSGRNLGGLFFPSYVRGYKLTGRDGLRRRSLQVSRSMAARFDPLVGAMRSRDGEEFNVIIDSLTKPRLLWWAVKAGGPARYDAIARAHALTIARDHVRPDGSTVHAAFYDPATGALKRVDKGAAYADGSTWARGQAWAVLGFPAAYRETRDPRFLEVARLVSDWWLRHVPDDMVPYWDFGAPDIPAAPRDTSAAAIAASGLIDLALLDPDEERRAAYAGAARETLASLMSPAYSSATWTPSVLLHGTYSWWMDISDRGLAYGDAFFLEALLRLRRLSPEEPPLPVVTARSATGVPSAAIDGSRSTSWAARGPQSHRPAARKASARSARSASPSPAATTGPPRCASWCPGTGGTGGW